MLGIDEQISEGVLELQGGVSAKTQSFILALDSLEAAPLQNTALLHSDEGFKNIGMTTSGSPNASPALQAVSQ